MDRYLDIAPDMGDALAARVPVLAVPAILPHGMRRPQGAGLAAHKNGATANCQPKAGLSLGAPGASGRAGNANWRAAGTHAVLGTLG